MNILYLFSSIIFNLFIVFLITNNKYFITLTRISLLLLSFYIFFDYYLLFNSINIITLFDGLFKYNHLLLSMDMFIILLAIIIIYSYNISNYKFNNEIILIQFSILLFISLILFSNDWLITIIIWEMFNISLYIFVSINKFTAEQSLSNSFKYIILSAISSCLFLLSFAIFYIMYGISNYDLLLTCLLYSYSPFNTTLALILILFTLLFKISAAPFYHWAPDLYSSLNLNSSFWMIIIPKLAVLFFMFILFHDNIFSFSLFYSFSPFILFFSILSILISSIGLYLQYNLIRFIAYSSISHIGYILITLINYDYNTFIFYLIIYFITNINLFLIFLSFSFYLNRNISLIFHLISLFKFNPFLTFALSISLFSLAGVCLFIILL